MAADSGSVVRADQLDRGAWVRTECVSKVCRIASDPCPNISLWFIPLLLVIPNVDRPSTLQARFSDRAGGCEGAFGLEKVGFECCQAGWHPAPIEAGRRAGGGWRPACRDQTCCPIVRRYRGSRRVAGACRCRAGCRKPLRCGGGGSRGTRTCRGSGAGHGRFRAPSTSGSRTHDGYTSARDGRALHRRPWAGGRGRVSCGAEREGGHLTRSGPQAGCDPDRPWHGAACAAGARHSCNCRARAGPGVAGRRYHSSDWSRCERP